MALHRAGFVAGLRCCMSHGVFIGAVLASRSGPAQAQVRFTPPEVVAPGVVSDGNTWRGSFSPDGRELYFFRRERADAEDYRIVVSRRIGREWSAPEPLAFGGVESDLYPAIAPDGNRMILVSYRSVPGVPTNAHLFVSSRVDGVWSEPEYVPELNEPGVYHAQPYFTADGALHFRRVGRRGAELWVAVPDGADFAPPQRTDVLERLAVPGTEVLGAFLSPDRRLVVLTVRVGPGDIDLYYAEQTEEGWTAPTPLGPDVNTRGQELFPFFSPDGRTLYFVRDFREMLASDLEGSATFLRRPYRTRLSQRPAASPLEGGSVRGGSRRRGRDDADS